MYFESGRIRREDFYQEEGKYIHMIYKDHERDYKIMNLARKLKLLDEKKFDHIMEEIGKLI